MKKILFISTLLIGNIAFSQLRDLTLEDAILKQRTELAPQNLKNTKWIPNSEYFSYQSDDLKTLNKQSLTNNDIEPIITLKELNSSLKLNEGLTHFYSLKWIDKFSFIINKGPKYYEFNVSTKKGKLIAELDEEAQNIDIDLKTRRIAYTKGKTLFVNISNNNTMTFKRKHEDIVVGQAIARFEFGISKGTFWSPNGELLAFYEKDELEVANYPLVDLNTTPADLNNIKYPMAGQKSEIAKVGIYNTSTKKVIYLKTKGEKYDYLTNLSWSPDGKYVLIAEVNRKQNNMNLNMFDASTGEFIKTLLKETNDKWVEPENPAYFINNNEFIWMSEKDGYMNLYKYSTSGKLINQLTKNNWVTSGIIGLDESKKNLIFTGTGKSPLEKHAFKINLNSGKQTQLTKTSGVHNVTFNSKNTYFIDNYSNVEIPRMIDIVNSEGVIKRNVLTAANPLRGYKYGSPEISTIKSADGSTDLYSRMIKPSDFNPKKKYPVLVYVYGGPHAQMITNRWLAGASMWMYYQAEQGYIIYTLDNRGSKSRGFAFESVIHRNLGENEMDDQLKGVEFLKSLPYVNSNRIAVHGWSFGGFMTTSLMLRHPGIFTTGVAGGPVTDWALYEIMYGERYMDMPDENVEGYKKAKLHNYVKNLKGNLLLIHGTVDDVVVPQHNYSLIKSFVDEGVQVDFFPYPMHPHNVRGKDRVHLMKKVLTYIEKNNRPTPGMRKGAPQGLTQKQREELMKLPKEQRMQKRKEMMQSNGVNIKNANQLNGTLKNNNPKKQQIKK